MAYESSQFVYSGLVAGATLGSAQYKGVILSSTGGVIIPNTTSVIGTCIGILQNKPAAAGDAATVAFGGLSKFVMAASTRSVGDWIACSTAGLGVIPSTDATRIGRIVAGSSGAVNRVVTVALSIARTTQE